MRKIVEYKIIRHIAAENLSSKINALVSEGWQPYGTPTTCVLTHEYFYIQAMVKYEEETNE